MQMELEFCRKEYKYEVEPITSIKRKELFKRSVLDLVDDDLLPKVPGIVNRSLFKNKSFGNGFHGHQLSKLHSVPQGMNIAYGQLYEKALKVFLNNIGINMIDVSDPLYKDVCSALGRKAQFDLFYRYKDKIFNDEVKANVDLDSGKKRDISETSKGLIKYFNTTNKCFCTNIICLSYPDIKTLQEKEPKTRKGNYIGYNDFFARHDTFFPIKEWDDVKRVIGDKVMTVIYRHVEELLLDGMININEKTRTFTISEKGNYYHGV